MNRSAEERLDYWNTEEVKRYIVHDIFLVAYFLIGIFGNTIVLIVYTTKIRKDSESRYFIPILAFVDLLACVLRAPFELWKTLLPVNFQNIVGCQIVWFLVNVFTFASILILAVITVQRYLKVCRPFGPQFTKKVRRASLVIISILAVAFSAPFIIWNEKLEIPNPTLNVTGYICGANVIKIDQNSNSFLSFIFFVSIILTFVMLELLILNTLIARKIFIVLKNTKARRKQSETAGQMSLESNPSSNNVGKVITDNDPTSLTNISECSTDFTTNKVTPQGLPNTTIINLNGQATATSTKVRKHEPPTSKKFSYMFMVIGMAYIVSYIPQIFLLFSLIQDRFFWIKSTTEELSAYKFLDQMVTINNIVNPYVYGFFDMKFRQAAKRLLCECKSTSNIL